jgi:1,4-alpha-glucan branching enzyme
MWAHPGKKLLFMGQEFAQDGEWNHDDQLPWHLLNNARNAGMRQLVRDLNRVYRELPAMHRQDCDGFGFDWLESTEATHSLLAWLRRDADGHMMIAVSNMTPVPQFGWRLGVPDGATGWREVLNTDSSHYGGGNVGNASAVLPVTPVASHGRAQSIMLVVPPLATIYLVPG